MGMNSLPSFYQLGVKIFFWSSPGSTVSSSSHSAYDLLSFMDSTTINPDGCCNLIVSAAISLNQDQV